MKTISVGAACALSIALCNFSCKEGRPPDPRAAGGGFHAPQPADVEHLLTLTSPDSVVGELVYVPVYSSVVNRVGEREYYLTATLSIHNIHLTESIRVTDVNYYNTRGQRLRELVDAPLDLGPLETKQFTIPRDDKSGGPGANFIVKWEAPHPSPSPLIEAVMISTLSQQGISFVTQGSVIRHLEPSETASTTADAG